MNSKKLQSTKKDRDWQEKIKKKVKAEKVELGHARGKEKFEEVVKKLGKKENPRS